MDTKINSFKQIGLLVVWALTGAVVGLALGWAQVSGLLVHWQNLGKLPENPVKIVTANARAVWAETASGKVYISSLEGGCRQAQGYVPRGEAASSELPVRRRPKPLENSVDTYESTQRAGAEIIYSM